MSTPRGSSPVPFAGEGTGGLGVTRVTEGLGRGDRRDRGPSGDDAGGGDPPSSSSAGAPAAGSPSTPRFGGHRAASPPEISRVRGGPSDGLGLVRVEAASYSEALREIRSRFGDDVSIVHTRVIRRKGMLGVLGATGVEVYVTGRGEYEEWRGRGAEPPAQRAPPRPAPETLRALPTLPGAADEPSEVIAALERLSRRIGHVMAERAHSSAPPLLGRSSRDGGAAARAAEQAAERIAAERHTAELRSPERIAAERDGAEREAKRAAAENAAAEHAGNGREAVPPPLAAALPRGVHPVVAAAKRLLEEGGFSPAIAAELLARLSRRQLPTLSGDARECRELARLQLRELVRPKLPPARPIPRPGSGQRRIVALVGPTGVGKTTTLAKLGALFRITERAEVAFITLDTYRIGAVDQLRRYADIIQVPLEVVSPGNELPEALERVRDSDLVLVDTAGRSQKDADRIAELREMLAGVGDLEVHLCLALSASPEAILAAADSFRAIGYSRILVTKLDEGYRHGVLLDLFASARTPVSYITDGQEVPDDIRPATLDRLEDLILGEH